MPEAIRAALAISLGRGDFIGRAWSHATSGMATRDDLPAAEAAPSRRVQRSPAGGTYGVTDTRRRSLCPGSYGSRERYLPPLYM